MTPGLDIFSNTLRFQAIFSTLPYWKSILDLTNP